MSEGSPTPNLQRGSSENSWGNLGVWFQWQWWLVTQMCMVLLSLVLSMLL